MDVLGENCEINIWGVGVGGGGDEHWGSQRHKGGWWPTIVAKGGGRASEGWFLENVNRQVGNGQATKFWSHRWAGKIPLRFVFPRLYHLCTNKEVYVGESGRWVNGEWVWEMKWRRELFDREIGATNALVAFISDFVPIVGSSDRWIWNASKEGDYTTKTAYSLIKASRNNDTSTIRSKEILARIWVTSAAHKAKVTAWRILRSRLPTCDNLRKRNVPLGVEETTCNACFHCPESVEHVFLMCPKVGMVWDKVQTWLGSSSVRPRGIDSHFDMFDHTFGQRKEQ